MDELLEILDRVDVVVGRRADQPHTRRAVPGLGHPRVDLVSGQLATFTRLGPLGHLDLEVVGIHQVLAGDAEAAAGHLLDRAPSLGVVESLGVLATFAGVALAADPVHRHGQGLVGLGGDAAVAHRPCAEPFDDLADGLDLVDGDRLPVDAAELEQPA